MKKIVLFIVSLMGVALGASAVSDALYIYRNDGSFNAFFRNQIDSISFSHYGADGLYHKGWQTQNIYTPDSVYSIPLATIDSISFRTPEVIVNRDVFPLTAEHDRYLSKCDTISFTLSPMTPEHLRPSEYNVVVSTYECMSFPDGIMARVVSIENDAEGYHYNCKKVGIESVYDQLICIEKGYTINPESRSQRIGDSLEKELWNKHFQDTINEGNTTTKISMDAVANIVITANIRKGEPPYYRIDLRNEFKSELKFNAKSAFKTYREKQFPKLKLGRIWFPGIIGLFFVPKLTLSAYFSEGGEVSLDFTAHCNRLDCLTYEYDNDARQWNAEHTAKPDVGINVASLSMDGYAEAGLITDLLLSVCGSASGIGLECSVGIKETVNFKFDGVAMMDEKAYGALKDCTAKTTIPQKFRTYVQLGLFGDGIQPASLKYEIEPQLGNERHLLPEFTKPEYTKGATERTAILKSEVTRDLLIPVSIGMAFYDKENNLIETQYKPIEYLTEKVWNLNGLECVFSRMEPGKNYTAYPLVKIMGHELRATPCALFPESQGCPDENHLHAIDLGLASGTKWACSNYGATKPEEFGGLYTWYEAMKLPLGDSWNLPTKEQFEELINSCIWEWTELNEVAGYKVIGPNGNYIFLPLAGVIANSDPYDPGWSAYWSSSCEIDEFWGECVFYLGFVNHDIWLSSWGEPSYWYSVRAVRQ